MLWLAGKAENSRGTETITCRKHPGILYLDWKFPVPEPGFIFCAALSDNFDLVKAGDTESLFYEGLALLKPEVSAIPTLLSFLIQLCQATFVSTYLMILIQKYT